MSLQDSLPFAVIGGNTVVEVGGQRVRGRLYPWGVVEGKNWSLNWSRICSGCSSRPDMDVLLSPVENSSHCDFVKLRNMLIRTHMHDLKDTTNDCHYENYRAQCIQNMTRYTFITILLSVINVYYINSTTATTRTTEPSASRT